MMDEPHTCENCRYGSSTVAKDGRVIFYCDRYSWKAADGTYLIGATNPNGTCEEWEDI